MHIRPQGHQSITLHCFTALNSPLNHSAVGVPWSTPRCVRFLCTQQSGSLPSARLKTQSRCYSNKSPAKRNRQAGPGCLSVSQVRTTPTCLLTSSSCQDGGKPGRKPQAEHEQVDWFLLRKIWEMNLEEEEKLKEGKRLKFSSDPPNSRSVELSILH